MSVGNLPPGASVLIKITYVVELAVEGENIVFSLPGSVAPWKQEAALDASTQSDVEKVKVKDQRYRDAILYDFICSDYVLIVSSDDLSIQVFVKMPFPIKTIECPTHNIKMKVCTCLAQSDCL